MNKISNIKINLFDKAKPSVFKGIKVKNKFETRDGVHIIPSAVLPRSLNEQSAILIRNQETRQLFRNFLFKNGKVSLEEYQNIRKNHPAVLVESLKYVDDMKSHFSIETTPNVSALASALAKEKFDEEYGKNNYVVVSIGTSPSFMTESMKELGTETIFLPISEASWLEDSEEISYLLKTNPNLLHVGNYLKKQGITPKELKNKKVLLIDYCIRGKTINLVKNLINGYCKIPQNQIEEQNLNDVLKSIEPKTKYYRRIEFRPDNILDEVYRQVVECMSNTPHYSVYNEKHNNKSYSITSEGKAEQVLFKDFENFSRPFARAYQLCVLNELYKLHKVK